MVKSVALGLPRAIPESWAILFLGQSASFRPACRSKSDSAVLELRADDAFGLEAKTVTVEPHRPLQIVNAKSDERYPRLHVHVPALGHRAYSPRPFGYCFSHSRPLNCVMLSSCTVPGSRHRALTLKPSGCERGT